MDEDDAFHVGSDAKAMLATVIAQEVEAGRLRWDSAIGEVLPDAAATGRPEYRHITITDLLLHRGAFSGADVATVAGCLAALALQIPFYTGVILLMRLALALKLNAAIAVISCANLALDVGLNAWLASFMGVTGIALSTSIVYACSFGLLLAVTRRRLSQPAAFSSDT